MLATHQLNRLPAAERGITIADFLVPIRIGEHMSAACATLPWSASARSSLP